MGRNNVCEITAVGHKASVKEILENYCCHGITPNTVRQLKFDLEQAGYNVGSISVSSSDHAFLLERDDYITHFYLKGGMWENEIV